MAVITGTLGNDTLTGTAAVDIITGDAGNDTLSGLGGADSLFGDAGNDRLDGGDGADSLFGGADNDILNGGEGADKLFGGTGTDTLLGGGGEDTLTGGAGADALDGGGLTNTARYADATGAVIVNLTAGTASGLGVGSDTLASIGNVIGSDFADIITGNGVINRLDGGLLGDSLVGLAGADVYVFDNAGDIADETGGTGTDRIESTVDVDLNTAQAVGAVENITLLGVGALDATGDALANVINGNTGLNTLTGNGGNDVLDGKVGNDRLFGNVGLDTLDGGDGNDRLYGGTENDKLNGGTGDDRLSGGAGNDVIDGGTGTDIMLGGVGDDQYFVSNSGEFALMFDSAGTDTVRGSISIVLPDGFENIVLLGTSSVDATGNDVGNVIAGNNSSNVLTGLGGNDVLTGDLLTGTGNVGADFLIGGAGADTINGVGGADFIYGGAGVDVLRGGSGADTFRYGATTDGEAVATDTAPTTETGDSIVGFVTTSDGFQFVAESFGFADATLVTASNFVTIAGAYTGDNSTLADGTSAFIFDSVGNTLYHDSSTNDALGGVAGYTVIATLDGTSTDVVAGDITLV